MGLGTTLVLSFVANSGAQPASNINIRGRLCDYMYSKLVNC